MKIKYGCDICDQYFEKVEDAMKCEKSHKVVYPTKIWWVPIAGHFLWAKEILKGNFIHFPKNEFGTQTLKDWLVVSVPLLTILILFFH